MARVPTRDKDDDDRFRWVKKVGPIAWRWIQNRRMAKRVTRDAVRAASAVSRVAGLTSLAALATATTALAVASQPPTPAPTPPQQPATAPTTAPAATTATPAPTTGPATTATTAATTAPHTTTGIAIATTRPAATLPTTPLATTTTIDPVVSTLPARLDQLATDASTAQATADSATELAIVAALSGATHSPDEQQTREAWIDGAPIWRRSYELAATTGQTTTIDPTLTLDDTGDVIAIRATALTSFSVNRITLPYYDAGRQLHARIGPAGVQVFANGASLTDVIIVIEYTKAAP